MGKEIERERGSMGEEDGMGREVTEEGKDRRERYRQTSCLHTGVDQVKIGRAHV